MRRPSNRCILLLVLIFACGYASAEVAKREASGGGNPFDTMKSMAKSIPLCGKQLSSGVEMMEKMCNKVQEISNGGAGRVLGGAFPCVISLDKGFECTGVSTKSDVPELVKTLIDPMPDVIFPKMLKDMVVMAVDVSIPPITDMLFGGEEVHKSKPAR